MKTWVTGGANPDTEKIWLKRSCPKANKWL